MHPTNWHSAQPAWDYIWSLFDRAWIPYGWWLSGEVPSRDPAWAENFTPPDPDEIETMFCAAVGNLMIRALGMFDDGYVIPNENNALYDGGTVAWVSYYDYYGTLETFDEEFAANHSGTLCLRPFASASSDQGHWATTWKGWVVQTFPPDGLNWDYSVEQSHDGGYYSYMVRPWNWLPITQAEYMGEDEDGGGEEPAPAPGNGTPLTVDLLVNSMTGNSFNGPDLDREVAEKFFPSLVSSMRRYEINSRERVSAYVAQMGAESGSFQWMREFSRGEGMDYGFWYGRGIGQLTWEDNYLNYQNATGRMAHTDPELVADNTYMACESAAWHWDYKDLNPLADTATWQSFYEITHRWWGVEAQPIHERDARYSVAWYALPEDLCLPGGEEEPDLPKEPEYLVSEIHTSSDPEQWAYILGGDGESAEVFWLMAEPRSVWEADADGWVRYKGVLPRSATEASSGAKAEPLAGPIRPDGTRDETWNPAAYQKARYGPLQEEKETMSEHSEVKPKTYHAPTPPPPPKQYVDPEGINPPGFGKPRAEAPEAEPEKPTASRPAEPVLTTAAIVGLIAALLGGAGVALSAEEIHSFEIVLGVLLPLIATLISGAIARRKVTPV